MSLWARCEQCGQYQPDPEGNGSAGLHHCPGAGRPHISDAEDPATVFDRFVSATQGPRRALNEAEREAADAMTSAHLARIAREQLGEVTTEPATTALPIRRRPLPEVVTRAADILEATMHEIDADKGEVSPSSWGSLLGVLGILRGDHEL